MRMVVMKDEEEIVISGISGQFPESRNMKEFMENLLDNKNMVTCNDRRFKSGLFDTPKGFGTLKDITKFDAESFGILPKQADNMDPQSRIAIETTYEALIDAGVNPSSVRGQRTGVFSAVMFHDALDIHSIQPARITGNNSVNLFGSLLANRISYIFDWIGPSANYDTACSSSIFALEAAVQAIQLGKCNDAFVIGSNLILSPVKTLMFNEAGMLSKEHTLRAFDCKGLGYVRAEAVVSIYVQKKSMAKRSYLTILGIGSNTDGYKEQGNYAPSAFMQEELLDEVYSSANVNPIDVNYIEAHGTGTPAGDPNEIKAISRFFCQNTDRKTPLLIGSVKSNMGHAESGSGLCSIAKLIVILQTGIIPANLNFENPHFSMKYIREHQVQVVTENTKWEGGLIGLSSFGFGGVNTHVIFEPNLQTPIISKNDMTQDIVLFSGKTSEGVKTSIEEILKTSSPDLLFLANEVHNLPIRSEKVRGFGITSLDDNEEPIVEISDRDEGSASIWYVFNGMGSQWVEMGQSLLKTVPIFKTSFDQCSKALKEFNYNLEKVFCSNDPNIFVNNPTNSFVCIGVIQIGLLDILKEIGVKADGFIGHSCGEHLCAYADKCLTKEETIISLYLRGQACNEFSSNGVLYGMAAVNMNFEKLENICPKGLYPVCDNGPESTTIAGPLDLIHKFKAQLEGIAGDYNVKEVNSSGMPFHSPYLNDSAKAYKNLLSSKMNIQSCVRSRKWISTSIPENTWESKESKMFTHEYFSNNFSSSVKFLTALRKIPNGSTVIEIGPSGLLRGLIQRGTKDCSVVALQIRNETNSFFALQKGLGRLFLSGINFDANKISSFRDNIKTPVPGNTPMLAHLVDWDHSVDWGVPNYQKVIGSSGVGLISVDLSNSGYSFLEGHTIQGRVLYPGSGYINMIWKLFAQMHSTLQYELPVVFENLKIHRATILRHQEIAEFSLFISDVGGYFEIKERDAMVCSGKIRKARGNDEKILDKDIEGSNDLNGSKNAVLNQEDIYKKLRHLGYEYHGLFRGIHSSDICGEEFQIQWNDNWVAFLDTCLQTGLRVYSEKNLLRDLSVPTEITKVLLDPIKFYKDLKPNVLVSYNSCTRLIKCKGVEIQCVKTANLSRNLKAEQAPIYSNYAFEPYFYKETGLVLGEEEYSPLLRCLSIVVDNMSYIHDKTIQRIPNIFEIQTNPSLSETLEINSALRVHFSVPEINYTLCAEGLSDKLTQTYTKTNIKTRPIESLASNFDWLSMKWDLIIVDNPFWVNKAIGCLNHGGFLIVKVAVRDNHGEHIKSKLMPESYIVAHKVTEYMEVFLIRKKTKQRSTEIKFIDTQTNDLNWINQTREIIVKQEDLFLNGQRKTLPRIYFISNGISNSGLLGFMNCIRKEPYSSQIRCIYSKCPKPLDLNNPEKDPLLSKILDQDLVFNVIDENGVLGCYVHSQIMKPSKNLSCKTSYVSIGTTGDLTTFNWFQGFDFSKHIKSFPPNYEVVEVHIGGLNFKDVMIATGNLYPEHVNEYPNHYQTALGLEFSGMATSSGRRVCGFAPAQCFSTQILVDKEFLLEVPDSWTLEDAATVPVVYATAYMALVVRGNIRRNGSVLIHSGAGGVGIAAIRIALNYNCQVFTTVSSAIKIEFIKKNFPEIPESNIGYSRDSRFEQMVLNGTKGKGVDLILNSLSGDKLEASLRCLAPHGQFLEIGRVDLSRNTPMGMDAFMKDVSFHGIFLMDLCDGTENAQEIWKLVKIHLLNGISTGVVQPLPYRSFNNKQIEPAFRYMAQGTHIGKILLTLRNKDEDPSPIPSAPQLYFDPEKVYVILGGLGGVGLEMINWMTYRYARKIVITSRTGNENLRGYTKSYIKIWQERGIEVEIIKFQPEDDLEIIFKPASQLGTIGGIFNLTMQMNPQLAKFHTIETFQNTITPKSYLTEKLDNYSRKYCPELDFFVVFSSTSAGLGYDGMTAYGYGNSSIERLVEERRKDGLPGTAIQFGPIGDVGAWHEKYNNDYNRSSFHGSAIQSIDSVLKSLDYLLNKDNPILAPVTLCRKTIELSKRGDGSQLLEATLLDRLAQILGHSDGSKLNVKCTLAEIGMESVTSIEAKNVLENEFGLSLSAAALRELTLEQLNELGGNKQNERTLVRTQIPAPKAATAGLVQLNFFKQMNRTLEHREIIYPMNELAKSAKTFVGPKVLICNSTEGPDVLRPLGALLKYPTFCLQFSAMNEHKTCQELALGYYKKIKENVPEGPYLVAGLSAGIFPGTELALMFEESDEITKFILMDMTFERFDAIVEENGGKEGDVEELSLRLMVSTSSQFMGFDFETVQEIMRGESTLEGKIKKFNGLVARCTGEEFDGNQIQQRIKLDWIPMIQLFFNYKQRKVYNGPVGLIKTTQNLIAYDTSCEDWGLGKSCSQKADILVMNTTHSYMIAEPAVQIVAKWFNDSLEQLKTTH